MGVAFEAVFVAVASAAEAEVASAAEAGAAVPVDRNLVEEASCCRCYYRP